MAVALQGVLDGMGHADPRTARRYDRGHVDHSSGECLAAVLLGLRYCLT